jgi:hypothetical protein
MAAMMKIISCQLEEIGLWTKTLFQLRLIELVGVDEESFVQACQGSFHPVPMKLIQFLERFSSPLCLSLPLSHASNSQANFISFGQNMEEKFHQLFPSKEIETSGPQLLLSSSPPDSRHGCP